MEASADDGKRRTAVLGVGLSPLRATKGGEFERGVEPPKVLQDAGGQRILPLLTPLGALERLFFRVKFLYRFSFDF